MRKFALAFPKPPEPDPPEPKPVLKEFKPINGRKGVIFQGEYQDFLDYAENGMSPLRFRTKSDLDKWWDEMVEWRNSLPTLSQEDRINLEAFWDRTIKEYRFYLKWVSDASG